MAFKANASGRERDIRDKFDTARDGAESRMRAGHHPDVRAARDAAEKHGPVKPGLNVSEHAPAPESGQELPSSGAMREEQSNEALVHGANPLEALVAARAGAPAAPAAPAAPPEAAPGGGGLADLLQLARARGR